MITEAGIVTSTYADTAWVKTTRSGACEACSSRKNCGTAHSAKEMVVKLENTLGVEKGDHVVIGLQTRPMLYLTFLLYVFPILMMIVGALIGDYIGPTFNMDNSISAMIGGFSFFGLSFIFLRKKNKSLSQNSSYKPFLIRKRPQAFQPDCSLS